MEEEQEGYVACWEGNLSELWDELDCLAETLKKATAVCGLCAGDLRGVVEACEEIIKQARRLGITEGIPKGFLKGSRRFYVVCRGRRVRK